MTERSRARNEIERLQAMVKRRDRRIAELEQLLADAISGKMQALQAKIDRDLDEAMGSDKWNLKRRVP